MRTLKVGEMTGNCAWWIFVILSTICCGALARSERATTTTTLLNTQSTQAEHAKDIQLQPERVLQSSTLLPSPTDQMMSPSHMAHHTPTDHMMSPSHMAHHTPNMVSIWSPTPIDPSFFLCPSGFSPAEMGCRGVLGVLTCPSGDFS